LPSKEAHITKADGNAALALSMTLENQAKIDWTLVILFYAAMHYVEAYLATVGQHLRSHTSRDNIVGRDAKLRKIFAEYQDLKYYGYNARYELLGFTANDVTNTAAKHFATIKAHIKAILQE
jgi:hypothetical protein